MTSQAWLVPAPAAFSLRGVIESHGWVHLPPFQPDAAGWGFSYVLRLASGRVIKPHIGEMPDNTAVEVMAGGPVSSPEREEISQAVTWMLGLNQDLAGFYGVARGHPRLAHAVELGLGRILRSPTLFEDVVKMILCTNAPWNDAIQKVEALVRHFGEPAPDDPSSRSFPAPTRLAVASQKSLYIGAGLGSRAPHVLELAQAIASGELDLEGLKTTTMPAAKLRRRLLTLPGIGPYAAARLLVMLGHYGFVAMDSWTRRLVAKEFYGGKPITPTMAETPFAPFGEWKGLACWFWDW